MAVLHDHEAARDVLHENGEKFAEPLSLFSEKCGLCNASRIHTRKNYSGILVVSTVELGYGHHVANLKKKRDL